MPTARPVPGANNNTWGTDLNGWYDNNVPTYLAGRPYQLSWLSNMSIYNFKASNTRKLREDIRRCRVGGQEAHWSIIGDSLSTGHVGGGSATGYDVLGAWPMAMRDALENQYGVNIGGTGIVHSANNPGNETQDWWPLGSQWTFTGTYDNAGYYTSLGTNGATATYVSDRSGTQVDLFYWNNSGTFTVTIDGVVKTPPTPTGAVNVEKVSYTGLSDSRHTVVITRNSAGSPTYFSGVQVTTVNRGLNIQNLSMAGAAAFHWASAATMTDFAFVRYSMLDKIGATASRVVFFKIGCNDILPVVSGGQNRTKAQLIADITTVRQMARFSGADAILVLEHDIGLYSTQNRTDYLNAIYDVADALDLPVIDFYDRHGSSAQMITDGVMHSDQIHYTSAGQRMAGQHMAEVIMNLADTPKEPTWSSPFPVKVATMTNVAALTGRQNVDTIACVPEDIVLLAGQTTGSQNGVWTVKEGAWVRSEMFNTAEGLAGSRVRVLMGTYGGSTWTTNFKQSDILGTATIYWAPDMSIDIATGNPPTPSSGLTIFSRHRARRLPAFMGPTGQDSRLQPALFSNRVCLISAINNATTATVDGGWVPIWLNNATAVPTAVPVASTNFFTSMVRTSVATPATANGGAGLRGTANWFSSTTANMGGYYMVARFGLNTVATNTRGFIGMTSQTGAYTPGTNPGAQLTQVGIYWDTGMTNMRFIASGTAAGTPVDLGVNFPTSTGAATNFYEVAIFVPSGMGQYGFYSITRVNDGVVAQGSFGAPGTTGTTTLPANGTLMVPQIFYGNGSNAAAHTMHIQSLYMESDN